MPVQAARIDDTAEAALLGLSGIAAGPASCRAGEDLCQDEASQDRSAGAPGSTPPAAAGDQAGARDKPSGGHRVLHILAAVLVGVVLPALLLDALVGRLGVSAIYVGAFPGAVLAPGWGGTRRMLMVAPVVGLAAGLGAFSAYDWWWAALLAATGVLAGAGIGFGWFAALLMVPYPADLCDPGVLGDRCRDHLRGHRGHRDAVRHRHRPPIQRPPPRRRRPPGPARGRWRGRHVRVGPGGCGGHRGGPGLDRAVLGRRARAHLGAVHHHRKTRTDPGKGPRDRARGDRRDPGGTAADPPTGVLAVVGTVVFVVALTQTKRYWLMYGLYTFSLVLLPPHPGQVGFEAEERGFQILVGIGLLVVGLFILHALGSWLAKHHPQPELAPTA